MTTLCTACDTPVSTQFARVMGDNDDRVHACPNCSTVRDRTTTAEDTPDAPPVTYHPC
ncbi:DUF7563 family protein [Halomarina oriensis]|uniref:DUF7563 family protein n=1 Tax=Halomarina oriensis TaxID=671145 RepID=UPI0018EF0AB9|nr:hypothetical protein [Halomarina oriensis]